MKPKVTLHIGTSQDQPEQASRDWQSGGHGFGSHRFTLVDNQAADSGRRHRSSIARVGGLVPPRTLAHVGAGGRDVTRESASVPVPAGQIDIRSVIGGTNVGIPRPRSCFTVFMSVDTALETHSFGIALPSDETTTTESETVAGTEATTRRWAGGEIQFEHLAGRLSGHFLPIASQRPLSRF